MWEVTQAWNLSTLPMLHLLDGFFRPALVWHTSNTLCRLLHTDGRNLILTFPCKTLSNSEVRGDGIWASRLLLRVWSSTWLKSDRDLCACVYFSLFLCVFIYKCIIMHTGHYILCFVLQYTLYVVYVCTVYMSTKEKSPHRTGMGWAETWSEIQISAPPYTRYVGVSILLYPSSHSSNSSNNFFLSAASLTSSRIRIMSGSISSGKLIPFLVNPV